MSMTPEKKEFAIFALVSMLAVLISGFMLFGAAGARIALGVFFLSLPFYLILDNFELSPGEKSVFSLLMGLTLFSSMVYLSGLVISFRISILLTFILLIIFNVIIKKLKLFNVKS
ncbi:hypothetical protein HYT54_04105 [Candidatus Woesearchaeota archaeon]|nr:hypothetical protein [Candidatus Woesearchaeota archaeon]